VGSESLVLSIYLQEDAGFNPAASKFVVLHPLDRPTELRFPLGRHMPTRHVASRPQVKHGKCLAAAPSAQVSSIDASDDQLTHSKPISSLFTKFSVHGRQKRHKLIGRGQDKLILKSLRRINITFFFRLYHANPSLLFRLFFHYYS